MTIKAAAILILALLPLFASADDIVFFSDNGHYYQAIPLTKPVSYDDARTLASARSHNSKQGYIVTIGTASEQAFLNAFVGATQPLPSTDWSTIWGGAQMSSNSWTWNALGRVSTPFFDANKLTCYTYGYCNWNVSLIAASFASTLNCLQIYLTNTNGPTPGTWRPFACTGTANALVVEYDASTTCDAGYVYRTSKGWCEDVDECANNPNQCGKGYQCVNTIGSYRCDDINECLNTSICKPGFQCVNGNGSYSCVDINECSQTPSVCPVGYSCNNLVGSYQCNDIDECNGNSSICGKGYTCANTPGSYRCDDFNECTQSVNKVCPFGTRCTNTIGSYTCNSVYFFIQSKYNGLVIGFYNASDGILRLNTQQQDPRNISSQLWSFTPQGFLINAYNQYVVDCENGVVYPSVKAILWPQKPIDKASNQLWEYDEDSFLWNSKGYDVVLDIFQGQYAPGAEICLFNPKNDGSTNQLWTVIESNLMTGNR